MPAERLALRRSPRHGAFADVALPALAPIPGQISEAERRFLYWLVRETYVGRGAVVEIGSWLGLSAAHLAAGLRDAGRAGALHCFDRFEWDQKKPIEERFRAQLKLAALPRNSAKTRIRNRCEITGRPRAYYRKLKMSRIALRDLGSSGAVPGLVKSSW